MGSGIFISLGVGFAGSYDESSFSCIRNCLPKWVHYFAFSSVMRVALSSHWHLVLSFFKILAILVGLCLSFCPLSLFPRGHRHGQGGWRGDSCADEFGRRPKWFSSLLSFCLRRWSVVYMASLAVQAVVPGCAPAGTSSTCPVLPLPGG